MARSAIAVDQTRWNPTRADARPCCRFGESSSPATHDGATTEGRCDEDVERKAELYLCRVAALALVSPVAYGS